VIQGIHDKMVRRHPHVFGEKRARDAKAVLKSWEKIKAEERKAKGIQDGAKPRVSAGRGIARIARDDGRVSVDASRVAHWIRLDSAEGGWKKYLKRRRSYGTRSPTETAERIEEEAATCCFAAVNVRVSHVTRRSR